MLEGYARNPACRKNDATETLTKTQKDIKPLVMRTKSVTPCIKSRDNTGIMYLQPDGKSENSHVYIRDT